MADIKIIDGEIFHDHRGTIQSINALDMEGVERLYFIENLDTSVIRGWHGHQTERKWFYCVSGAFTMAFIEIDDWERPSRNLKPQICHISESKSRIIAVPPGYANCIRADMPNSKLLVLSGRRYPECLDDSWRYTPDYWFEWDRIPRAVAEEEVK